MPEYIEREAALKILRGDAVARYPSSFYYGLFAAADEVKKVPAADVVAVVRCKDCKYYGDTAYGDMCKRWEDWLPTEDDDFCSYGERRADDEL